MTYERSELRWNGWGLRSASFDFHGREDAVWSLVRELVALDELPDTRAMDLAEVELPQSRLTKKQMRKLREACADVRDDHYERAFHALGKSYADLVRLRAGDIASCPDAIVYPASHGETLETLAVCHALGVAVIPFGGGSSVVGGVEAQPGRHRGVVTLDTTCMRRMLDLDEIARTATFEAGVYGPELEGLLQQAGFTLGHYPQSFEFSTLGGWVAARGAGQQSNRYGPANEWLVAARLASPAGEWRTLPFPQSAAGPDMNAMICGSEGTLGVITEATVRVHRTPARRDYRAFLFRGFDAGAEAVRALLQAELPLASVRLSDEAETHFFGTFQRALKPAGAVESAMERVLGAAGYGEARCLLLVGCEGEESAVRFAHRHATLLCARHGGAPLGGRPGRSWYRQRFALPYLRDPLLDRGVGVDTLETSTEWSNVSRLHHAVRSAISEQLGGRGVVLAHISHSYLDGASLYFTYLFARELDDELGQWRRVKRAASEAIAEHGGTISHHHGVGIDHREWFAPEKGALAVEMLRAAKSRVDPDGVLNPGKLLP